jgi:hypothetical protein
MPAKKLTRGLLESEQQLLAARELRTRLTNTLRLFRPLEHQEAVFKTIVNFLLIAGGNRSGKTTAMIVKTAAFAMKQSITFADGTTHSPCPERWKNTPLLIWVVGLDWRHIGQTIYPKLFEPGLFQIIYDKRTSQWRAVDESQQYDIDNLNYWQPAPPLIPPTEIDQESWSWDDQAKHQFTEVRLKNGTIIRAYPSTGYSKQGDNVHLVSVDEQLADDTFFGEFRARVAQSNGYIWWSTWATFEHDEAQARLRDLCMEEANSPNPIAEEHNLETKDNKFMNERSMHLLLAGLSPEEKAARGSGISNTASRRIYPAYRTERHATEPLQETLWDGLTSLLRSYTNGIPKDWCIYLIVDPGTVHPAALFVAVPPPPFDRFVVPYDEYFGERGDSYKMARNVKIKLNGRKPQGMIIDGQAAQITPTGFSQTVNSRYVEAFRSEGIVSYSSGCNFWKGSNDIKSRQMALTTMLEPDPLCSLSPRLRIQNNRCPSLNQQLLKARRNVVKGIPQEGTYARQTIDVMVCLEYYAARDPGYVAPQDDYVPVKAEDIYLQEFFRKQREQASGDVVVNCGPR